jgi:hypothetical protein
MRQEETKDWVTTEISPNVFFHIHRNGRSFILEDNNPKIRSNFIIRLIKKFWIKTINLVKKG